MKKLFFYIGFLSFLISCNTTKRVAENEYLLIKNTVFVDSIKSNDLKLKSYLTQKPNNKSLGVPLALFFYNLGNKKSPRTPTAWGKKNKNSYRFIKNIFSEKQSIAYANAFIGFNHWFLENGQAPSIISDQKIKKSLLNLETYMNTEGYFKPFVSYTKDSISKKKAAVNYYISTGKPLFLENISTDITSPVIDSLYTATKSESFLKPNTQYKDINFRKEANRITKYFRNSGVFHFSENLIGFYNIDTSRTDYKTDVVLKISDRIEEKNGKYLQKKLEIQKIKNIRVYTDYAFNTSETPYLDKIGRAHV